MKILAIDLETTAALIDPVKSDGLNPFRARIAVVSWYLLGGQPKYEYVLNQDGIPHSVHQLAKVWRSPDYTLVGTNLMFDLIQLYWHYPGLFTPQSRRCKVCSIDLLVRCILGDYRDQQEQLKWKAGGAKRNYLCDSYGLKHLTSMLTDLPPLDKSYQLSDWSYPLSQEEIDYCLADVVAPMTIYNNLQDCYTGRNYHNEVDTQVMKVVRRRLQDKNPEWLNRYELEQLAWDRAFVMNTQLYRIDLNYYSELTEAIATVRAVWLERYYELETELNYTQKEALARKYGLEHVDKTAYMNLPDNDLRKPLLKTVVALSAIATAQKQAESLLGWMTPGTNWCNWNSCSGTGRSVSSNKGLPFPNLQSIKTRMTPIDKGVNFNLRKLIVPAPGKVFFNMDMPTAHLRIAFFITECANGVKMLRDGTDIHSYTAYQIYNKCEGKQETYDSFRKLIKTDNLAKNYRGWAKNTIFAWLNGAGVDRIKAQIEAQSMQQLDRVVVEELRTTINDLFWEVPAWIQQVYRWLNDNGETYLDAQGKLIHFFSLLNCPHLRRVPIQYRPYLSFAGYSDGVKYTEPPASIWANVEVAVKKRLLSKIEEKLVIDHYDGYTFELDEETWYDRGLAIVQLLRDEFVNLYGADYPHGIDDDYIKETMVAYHWWN